MRHSLFVICVPRSQNFTQSSSVLPPPPAVLCADSLGLVLPEDGEGILSVLTLPPVRGIVVVCGESGAVGEGDVIGAPIADEEGAVVAGGAAGAVSFGAAALDLD
jgi:hypothetical protein